MSHTETGDVSEVKQLDNFYGRDMLEGNVAAKGPRSLQMLIRKPVNADAAAVLALGRVMHAESPHYNTVPFEEERAREVIQHVIQHQDQLFCEVGTFGDEIVAMIALTTTELMFSRQRVACDVLFYIKPEFRLSLFAKHMMQNAMVWCKGNNVKFLVMGVTTGIHEEVTCKMYSKLGFSKVGTLMRKEF